MENSRGSEVRTIKTTRTRTKREQEQEEVEEKENKNKCKCKNKNNKQRRTSCYHLCFTIYVGRSYWVLKVPKEEVLGEEKE